MTRLANNCCDESKAVKDRDTHKKDVDTTILECLHPASLYLLPAIILVPLFLPLVAHYEGEEGLILEYDHLSVCHKCHVTPRDTRVTQDLLSRSLNSGN